LSSLVRGQAGREKIAPSRGIRFSGQKKAATKHGKQPRAPVLESVRFGVQVEGGCTDRRFKSTDMTDTVLKKGVGCCGGGVGWKATGNFLNPQKFRTWEMGPREEDLRRTSLLHTGPGLAR